MTIRTLYPETDASPLETYTLVVDGMELVPGRRETEELSARQQVEVLQKLSKIQQAEDWDMWVLFNGEPLPQVDHGGDFFGLRVFFSPTPPQRIPTLLECVKVLHKKNRGACLVTNDVQAETRARKLGAATLRADTLKKGYDSLFITRSRPQSRLMRHRTVDQRKSQLEDGPDIRDMIDLVE